jgi:hypothetical protein
VEGRATGVIPPGRVIGDVPIGVIVEPGPNAFQAAGINSSPPVQHHRLTHLQLARLGIAGYRDDDRLLADLGRRKGFHVTVRPSPYSMPSAFRLLACGKVNDS